MLTVRRRGPAEQLHLSREHRCRRLNDRESGEEPLTVRCLQLAKPTLHQLRLAFDDRKGRDQVVDGLRGQGVGGQSGRDRGVGVVWRCAAWHGKVPFELEVNASTTPLRTDYAI